MVHIHSVKYLTPASPILLSDIMMAVMCVWCVRALKRGRICDDDNVFAPSAIRRVVWLRPTACWISSEGAENNNKRDILVNCR